MSRNPQSQEREMNNLPQQISLESIKVHDSIRIGQKNSSFWHIEQSGIRGLQITAFPYQQIVMLLVPEKKPMIIPFANIPEMQAR